MAILDEILRRTRERIEEQKKAVSPIEMRHRAEEAPAITGFPFERALRGEDISFICEIKKASPSKGILTEDFDWLKIAHEYEEAGADAISILTEPFYFQGSNRYLAEAAEAVALPLLRKDFIMDEYMLHEARVLGASAVLLIVAALEPTELAQYIQTTRGLGLSALVETHSEWEVETALLAGADIIGVNNRDLKTFEVNLGICERLRPYVPQDKLFVAESGIRTPENIQQLRDIGVDAALIGETFMRSSDKVAALAALRADG